MTKPITIAVDAMGGENSPHKTIEGISLHSRASLDIFYNIYGNEKLINPLITKFNLNDNKFKIIHTDNKVEIIRGNSLTEELSEEIFSRSGQIKEIKVCFRSSYFLF